MSLELDLTFLTPEEISHLRSVLERAKILDEYNRENGKSDLKVVTSDEVIRSRWKENHATTDTGFTPACIVVAAALDSENTEPQSQESWLVRKKRKESGEFSGNESDGSKAPISATNTPEKAAEEPHEEPREDAEVSDAPAVADEESGAKQDEGKDKQEDDVEEQKTSNETTPKKLEVENLDEERDQLAPLPDSPGPESPTSKFDTTSMISRSSLHPNEYVGEIEITLTFYPPNSAKQTTFPSKGTRFPDNNSLDVLTRKNYVLLTGSKIALAKDTKCGALAEKDGELHLHIKGAIDLNLPSSMRHKARTYAKCYILPDRYHGSKMRSEIIKDTLNPKYDHKFVFRGFTRQEFNERSIELIIGGLLSAHGRHAVVGGVRLSNGEHDPADKSAPWKDSNEEEVSVWKNAFDQPTVEIAATLPLRPNIKLTYK